MRAHQHAVIYAPVERNDVLSQQGFLTQQDGIIPASYKDDDLTIYEKMRKRRAKEFAFDVLGKQEHKKTKRKTTFTALFARVTFQEFFFYVCFLGQLGFGYYGLAAVLPGRRVKACLRTVNPLILATLYLLLGYFNFVPIGTMTVVLFAYAVCFASFSVLLDESMISEEKYWDAIKMFLGLLNCNVNAERVYRAIRMNLGVFGETDYQCLPQEASFKRKCCMKSYTFLKISNKLKPESSLTQISLTCFAQAVYVFFALICGIVGYWIFNPEYQINADTLLPEKVTWDLGSTLAYLGGNVVVVQGILKIWLNNALSDGAPLIIREIETMSDGTTGFREIVHAMSNP